jgi:hypothetical protein
MAVPVLAKALPRDYATLLEARDGGTQRLSLLERERFGWDHGEAAALLADAWKLPRDLSQLMKNHASEVPLVPLAALPMTAALAVSLSSLLPPTLDAEWHEFAKFDELWTAVRGGNGPSAEEILTQADRDFQEFAPVLNLGQSGETLAERYTRGKSYASCATPG